MNVDFEDLIRAIEMSGMSVTVTTATGVYQQYLSSQQVAAELRKVQSKIVKLATALADKL